MAFTPTTKLLACLGAAWLASGCVITDDDEDTDGTSVGTTAPTSGGTEADSGTGNTDPTNNTAGQTGSSGGTTDAATDTGADSTTDAATDTGADSSGGGVGFIEACTAACEAEAACNKEDPKGCMEGCEDDVVALSGCEAEGAAQANCVAALDCQGIADWLDEVPKGAYPCMAEDEALFACLRGA